MKVQRQQFLDSQFFRLELTSFEKRLVHHNRYHLEITLDKQNIKVKKKYSELKRFSEEVEKNLGVRNFSLEQNIRTSDQYKAIEQMVKRLNTEYFGMKDEGSEKFALLKKELRNYLYNTLFDNDSGNDSDQQQPQQPKHITQSPPAKFTNQQKQTQNLKNKSLALAAQLVSTVLKKVQTEPIKQIFKSINIVWIKRGQEWHQCRLITSETSLILYDRQENVKIVIVLCKMNVAMVEEPYQRIVLGHRLLGQKLEFRLSNLVNYRQYTNSSTTNINPTTITSKQQQAHLSDRYLAFYSMLKCLCHKQRMIETFSFVKVRIGFGKGSTITKGGSSLTSTTTTTSIDKKGKQLAIKLIHNTVISAFTLFAQQTCQILCPIVSNFGVIEVPYLPILKFFTTQTKQNGLLPSFKQNLTNFTIPVQNIYDSLFNQKPKRKTEIHNIPIDTKSSSYVLNLQYEEAGSYETYYSCDWENDRFEGNVQFEEMSRDQLRVQFNRLKRIVWTVEGYVAAVRDLRNFVSPVRSYLFYAVLVLIVLFANLNYLVHYVVALLIMTLLYNHPSFPSYLRQTLQFLHLTPHFTNLKPHLFPPTPPQQIHLTRDLQKQSFLQNFQLTMKKKRNIYKKYKRLQEILLKAQNVIMEIANYVEKVKNLFVWYHHKKTRILYLGLVAVLGVIVFVPVRVILLVAIYKAFKKGKNYQAHTQRYNQQVVHELYLLTIKENKLQDTILPYLNLDTKPLNKNLPEYQLFQKKSKQNLRSILGIDFNPNIFQQAKTLKQSKTLLSNCRKRYRIPLLTCRKYELNQKYAYEESSFSKVVLGFISVIPSDRNILGVRAQVEVEGEEKPGQGNNDRDEDNDQFDI